MTDYDLMNTGILGVGMDPYTVPGSEFVDESTDVPYEDRIMEMADRERMEELMRLASMEQYPTEEEEEGNWLANLLTPGNIAGGVGKFALNKALGLSGFAGLVNPLGWAGAGLAGLGNQLRGGVSQNAFEQARNQRRTQSRIDYMMDRRAAGKDYSETNLKNLLQQTGQVDTWQPPQPKAPPTPRVPDFIRHGGGNGGGNQGGGGQAAADAAGGSSYSSPFNRGGLAALWQR